MPAIDMELPEWAGVLFQPFSDKVVRGGRGSGKSTGIAKSLLIMSMRNKLRICVARQFQNSIKDSNLQLFKELIEEYGLERYFRVNKYNIVSYLGGEIFFAGLERSLNSSRGWQGVDILWVEEAQFVTDEIWKIVRPAIRKEHTVIWDRDTNAEIWWSFNPHEPSDPIWKYAVMNTLPNSVQIEVNYYDNPWFPKRLERERKICLELTPWEYEHVWLGAIDAGGETRKILNYKLVLACVEAFDKYMKDNDQIIPSGRAYAGLDIGDSPGGDHNALIGQKSGMLLTADRWRSPRLFDTSLRAHDWCNTNGVKRLSFDVGGMGAGIRSDLLGFKDKRYYLDPVLFGGKVSGPDEDWSYEVSNRDMFANRAAQMAWALKIRALFSSRYIEEGSTIDPRRCFFIDSGMPQREEYIAQLTQPEWEENPSGKHKVDKCPDDKKSPDLYDATVLAFTQDSISGLRFPVKYLLRAN